MKNVDDQIKQLDQKLDEYENLNGLPKFQNKEISDEINFYINMNVEEIGKLNIEDCAAIASRLTQQAFHIQRLYNRERAKATSIQATLDRCVARHIHNYNTFIKHEVNVAAIINENEYAEKLYKIMIYAKQRINRLYGLSEKLQKISDSFLAIQRTKLSLIKNER